MRLEEALTPAILLNRLAVASPTIEKKQAIKIITIKGNQLGEKNNPRKDKTTIGVKNEDIKAPSSVFFGLILGRNFLLPNLLPEK